MEQIVADYRNLTAAKIEFSFDEDIDGEFFDEKSKLIITVFKKPYRI
ncbi:hypothetical protein LB467_15855 [Salegentibacter sp. JZCK2]|nr:hypothetical protein [Salegentibacter tibetensis]MBZ9731169.1 hypothetical protein [Salegentibacter tibetensis]